MEREHCNYAALGEEVTEDQCQDSPSCACTSCPCDRGGFCWFLKNDTQYHMWHHASLPLLDSDGASSQMCKAHRKSNLRLQLWPVFLFCYSA